MLEFVAGADAVTLVEQNPDGSVVAELQPDAGDDLGAILLECFKPGIHVRVIDAVIQISGRLVDAPRCEVCA